MMPDVTQHPLSPPALEELVEIIRPALQSNYNSSSISVVDCPDLGEAPFHIATAGLSGRECIADIGGQPNLFPDPRLDRKYSICECAQQMGMSRDRGGVIGAGAGPWFDIGTNSELAANVSWDGEEIRNCSYYTKVDKSTNEPVCERSPSTGCSLMMNLYGSDGRSGPVLKITARGQNGDESSFTECIRQAIKNHYGPDQPISIGGVFVIKSGRSRYHVMPDFPKKPHDKQYTFSSGKEISDWLTYHNFSATFDSPIVCLTVFHSADPWKLGLRMEHTHCFTTDGSNRGGHYHNDLEGEDVEYEAYLNTAKTIYRIDKPEVVLERDRPSGKM